MGKEAMSKKIYSEEDIVKSLMFVLMVKHNHEVQDASTIAIDLMKDLKQKGSEE